MPSTADHFRERLLTILRAIFCPEVTQRSQRWAMFLFAATVLVYLRALDGGFVWDDRTFFLDNDILPNLKPWNLKTIFMQPVTYWGENLPLSEFLFVLEYYAFGTFTPAYHAVSLLLYLLVGAVTWRFVRNLYESSEGADVDKADDFSTHQMSILVVMSLFLLHPVHVEVVAYIVGQQHLLYALFSLLSLNIFWEARKKKELHRIRHLVPAIVCYYLAVLSKYQAISTGLFIPLYWLIIRRKGEGRPVKILALWGFANIPVILWLRFSIEEYGGIAQAGVPLLTAVLRGMRILGAHLLIALKPYPLNFGYPFNHAWSFDLSFVAGVLVVCALLVMLILRSRSAITIGLLIFVIYFFPIMQLFIEVSNATIYDRYLFVPLLGICIVLERLLALMVLRWQTVRWAFISLLFSILVTLVTLTHGYILKFRSDVISLEHAYKTFPGWKRAAFDYEYALIEAGLLEEAMRLVETEQSFAHPSWVRDYFRGWIQLERGDVRQALPHLERSSRMIHREGYFPFADVHLGRALIQTGDFERAERLLKNVIASPINQPLEQYRAKKIIEEIANMRIKRK